MDVHHFFEFICNIRNVHARPVLFFNTSILFLGCLTFGGISFEFTQPAKAQTFTINTDQTDTVTLPAGGGTAVVETGVTIAPTPQTGIAKFGIVINTGDVWAITNNGTVITADGSPAFIFSGSGAVTNAGTITASGSGRPSGSGGPNGIQGGTTLTIDNLAGGLISSNVSTGSGVSAQGLSLNNAGTIQGGIASNGISLSGTNVAPSNLTNTGTISGGVTGISVGTRQANITNKAGGQIIGGNETSGSQYYAGIIVTGGSSANIINEAGATISAANGISSSASLLAPTVSVTNAGLITGSTGSGIRLVKGGTVANQTGGVISGVTGISNAGAGSMIVNAGTITGSNGTAIEFTQTGNFSNTLTLDTGSILNGMVRGGPGDDTLILKGKDAEEGDKFTNFETLSMQGIDWVLSGDGTFSTSSDVVSGILYIEGNLTSPVISVYSDGTLAGAGGINGNVINSGTVAPGGSTIGTLTITGNYTGTGGTLALRTVLGDDSSMTDHLIVDGNTSGTSLVRIFNTSGTGAQTVEGIRIIKVTGVSEGSFALIGDYETLDNRQAIRAGAYAYTLEQNGISDPSDGNWYLRSTLQELPIEPEDPQQPDEPGTPGEPEQPRYQAGASVYEDYPQALLAMNGVSTLRQRTSNRVWAGNADKMNARSVNATATPYAAPEEAGVHIDGNGVWGRVEGAHNRIQTGHSTTNVDYSQSIFKLQTGIDGMLMENERGILIGGVSLHYAHGLTKATSVYDTKTGGGRISTDGYGLGGTLTWYGERGLYLDAQAQATWYNSNLSYDGGNRSLVDGNDGFGYALSIEGGRHIALNPAWSFTPQAQLVYSNVNFDDFQETGTNTHIGLDRGDSLQARLGVALDHQAAWQNANDTVDRAHVYGIVNLHYEFLEGSRVDVADVSFANRNDRLWSGIGLGGSYNWDNDRYSFFGEASVSTSLNSFASSYLLKGNVGFRMKW